MKSLFWTLIPFSMLLAAGCSGDAAPEPGDTGAADTGAPAADTSTTDAPPAVSESPAPTANDDSAVAAVQKVVDGIAVNDASVIWGSMPPQYQTDINEVVQAFGNNMDPNVWNQVRGALEKIHTVLSTKSEFIMNTPSVQTAEDPEQLKKVIPQVASLFKTILDNTDLKSLQSFDGQKFFEGPASSLIQQLDGLSQLSPEGFSMTNLMKGVKVEAISEDGDRATLKISHPEDPSKDQEQDFVRVDGHWVTADMADNWDSSIQMARIQMETLPQTVQEQAPMIAMFSNMIIGMLDPLAAAEDQEQFDFALQQLQAGIGGMMGPMLGGMGGGAPGAPGGLSFGVESVEPELEPETESVEEESPEEDTAEEPAAEETSAE